VKTSYFRHYATHHLRGGISIARSAPRWVKGYRVYRPLNPGPWFRSCKTANEYIDRYVDEILTALDAEKTYRDLVALALPHEPILLCWETPDTFCHRDIVRFWFSELLDIDVHEIVNECAQRMTPVGSSRRASKDK